MNTDGYTQIDERTIHRLLEGGPAVRWQVMRDLFDAPVSRLHGEVA